MEVAKKRHVTAFRQLTRPGSCRQRILLVKTRVPRQSTFLSYFQFTMEPEVPQVKKRKVEDADVSVAPVSNLLIKRHSEKARLPTRGSPLAAGYDLYR
jgi:hypothetical protein